MPNALTDAARLDFRATALVALFSLITLLRLDQR
jgi:hypothetical protein